jgi:hypothetical protein
MTNYIMKYSEFMPGGDLLAPLEGGPQYDASNWWVRNTTPWNKGKKTGQVAWNKGKKTGLTPWNKGKKNCWSDEQIARITSHGVKVTEAQKDDIRLLRHYGWKLKEIAGLYNIGVSTVSIIINNKVWKDGKWS